MFLFAKNKLKYDENNPCDHVISRLIDRGKYIGTNDSYEFIEYENKIVRLGTSFMRPASFSVCEVTNKEGFDVGNAQNSEWLTLWCGSAPSNNATERLVKFLNDSRKKLWENML